MDSEKHSSEQKEVALSHTPSPTSGNASDLEEIDHAAERRLIWKLDKVIVPLTITLYLLAYLDRGNAGNAKLQGLLDDVLGGSDQRFSVVLAMFYVAYIVRIVSSPCL